jgi:hypothetical protein
MAMLRVKKAGAVGVIKDLSLDDLPPNAWTDCSNIRFLDGSALQFYGHGEVYNSPSVAPQYVMPVYSGSTRYWIYVSAAKAFVVTNSGGSAVHTDITHATPHTGVVNQWTGTVLGGIPILNVGDTSKVPMYWDLNTANDFVNLSNWPANTYCKFLRRFKNILIAGNITESGTNYPTKIMFSHPADPGTLPTSWDDTDATKDAGDQPIADAVGPLVDGMELKDSFILYAENSTHALDYVGGVFILRNRKVFGMSGAMNRNCIAEFDGWHLVLTNSDVVIHEGYNAQSVLDKRTRRYLFQNIDTAQTSKCFVFRNPFLNEIFVCYPSIGATSCDKAMVYNFVDKTVSFRSLPNINHADCGPVDNSLAGNWNQDSASWSSDLTVWNGQDFTPDVSRVIMASADTKLFMLDASASFDGSLPSAYLERRGMTFDAPEYMKLIKGIRARITGNNGDTVTIKVGGHNTDPYTDPTYDQTMTHTIGTTLEVNPDVSYRYPAIRFETGTAYQWRLDSYDVEFDLDGMY